MPLPLLRAFPLWPAFLLPSSSPSHLFPAESQRALPKTQVGLSLCYFTFLLPLPVPSRESPRRKPASQRGLQAPALPAPCVFYHFFSPSKTTRLPDHSPFHLLLLLPETSFLHPHPCLSFLITLGLCFLITSTEKPSLALAQVPLLELP